MKKQLNQIINFGNKLKFYEKVNTYIWNNAVGLKSLLLAKLTFKKSSVSITNNVT